MKYKNLSDYTKKSLTSALTKNQYIEARRWGIEAEDIRNKDQRWFDAVARKNKRGNAAAFYSRDITEEQFAALVKRGFDPNQVKRLNAMKAAEVLTNHIFQHEDDWEFVDAFKAWLSKSKSQGTLYMETYAIAKARRDEAQAQTALKATVKQLKVAKRPCDADDDATLRAVDAFNPDLKVRQILEGLITHGFTLDDFRHDATTSVLFADDPEPEAFARAISGLTALLEERDWERNNRAG